MKARIIHPGDPVRKRHGVLVSAVAGYVLHAAVTTAVTSPVGDDQLRMPRRVARADDSASA